MPTPDQPPRRRKSDRPLEPVYPYDHPPVAGVVHEPPPHHVAAAPPGYGPPRRRSLWPLLAIIVLAPLPLMWLARRDDDTRRGAVGTLPPVVATRDAGPTGPPTVVTASGGDVTATGSATAAAATQRFLDWVERGRQGAPSADASHVTDGLHLLAAAIDAAASDDLAAPARADESSTAPRDGVDAPLQRLRAQADRLAAAPRHRQASIARAAFTEAARAIGALDGDAPAARVLAAAQAIRAERSLDVQGAQVRAFFDAATAELQAGMPVMGGSGL